MSDHSAQAIRTIRSSAPIRICDNGGWTDTWFAGYGRVLNIAVSPTVDVELRVFADDGCSPRFTIDARNYGERYSVSQPKGADSKHPLLEAALECVPVPDGLAVELSVSSEAPAGASTGTSAALLVAVVGALDCLTPGRSSEYELAAAAHRVETEFLHRQCGIQDQIAAAFGGISFIEMDRYPHAKVHRVRPPAAVERELEARLALVYAGTSHSSSDVHEMVIRELEDAGPEAPQLQRLRMIAEKSKEALVAGDLTAFGRCMIESTEAQRSLHPKLIGSAHQQIIDIAREHGVAGWKINGAGGEGGSVTLLCGAEPEVRAALLRDVEEAGCGYRNIPIKLSSAGVWVEESGSSE